MHHGYEPSRIAHLMEQARRAASDLDAIRSTDPSAAAAMAALAGLNAVVVDRIIPAASAVGDVDPLGGSMPPVAASFGPHWYGDWLTSLVVTDFSRSTDDQLFAELERREDALPYDENLRPDMSDPFWTEFEQLAVELAVRAEVDPDFAARLAEQAVDTFLIPLALRFARFDPQLVAKMLITVSEWPSWSIDLTSNYRTFAADQLVDFLVDFPEVALQTLADPEARRGDDIGLLEDLLLWPGLDPVDVTRFLDAAMSVPFVRPDLLPLAGDVVRQLVEIANGRSFPNGFPTEFSPMLAKIVVQYLPFFITGLNGRGDVHLKGFHLEDIGLELGSYGDVIDLLGAMMRDATSLEIMLGVIPTLALLGRDASAPLEVDLDDVANYLQALRTAAENEQLEEGLTAAREREVARLSIDLIFGAIDLITMVLGPVKAAGAGLPLDVVKGGAQLFADWAIQASDLGLDSVATIASLLMAYGLGIAIARDRTDDDDDQPDDVSLAESILERIERAFAEGRSIGEVEGLIGDLTRVLSEIDPETAEVLNDVRVVPSEYDVVANVDSEG